MLSARRLPRLMSYVIIQLDGHYPGAFLSMSSASPLLSRSGKSGRRTGSAVPLRRPASLAQQLVERLTTQIRSGDIAPGGKLPTEAEIIVAHGVSRTVVREAISRLSAQGLVVTRHGIGTFVTEGSPGANFSIDPSELATILEVLAVLELRISLETEAAALAAERRTDAQLKALRRACDAFAAGIAKQAETIRLDFQFHLLIAEATGNRFFKHLMEYLGTMIIPRTRVNTANLAHEDRTVYLQRVCREHDAIYDAILKGNAEAARRAMRTHLANSRERLRRAHASAVRAAGRKSGNA